MEVNNGGVAGKHLSLVEAFGDIPDPRVAGRSKHNLVEMLVVTVSTWQDHGVLRRRKAKSASYA